MEMNEQNPDNESDGNLMDDLLHNKSKLIPFWSFFFAVFTGFAVGVIAGLVIGK